MSDFNLTYTQIGDLGNKIGGQEGAKGILSGDRIVVSRTDPRARALVLQFERKVPIAARRFVASESFTKNNTKVKFGYIDERIQKLFGKIQENVPAGELAIHMLLKNAHDPDIMAALKPHSVRFIKLGQFYQLIEDQGHGQEGPLLVNGRAKIAYVLDDNGAPWAVNAYWNLNYGDWSVSVYSVADLSEWNAGYRVLSQVA